MKLAPSACLLLASSAAAFVPAQQSRAFVTRQPPGLSAKAFEESEINTIVSSLPHLDANEKANLKSLLFKAGEVVPASSQEDVVVLSAATDTADLKEDSMRGESSIEIASSSESQEAPVDVVVEKQGAETSSTASETTSPAKEGGSVSGETSLEVASSSSSSSGETAAKQQDEVVASILQPNTPVESAPVDDVLASGGDAANNLVTEVLNSHSEVVEGVVNALSQL